MLALRTPYASRPVTHEPADAREDEAWGELLREAARPRRPATTGPVMPPLLYFAGIGPRYGPLGHDAGFYAIPVVEAREGHTSIGEALLAGQDHDGLALWQLTIDGFELPGLWGVIDGEFWPV